MLKTKFGIQVNDRGGKHFRKYTADTLRAIFDISPTAANFELMVLIEGLVFVALRTHFIVVGNEKGYGKFIKGSDRLGNAIKELNTEKIISDKLRDKLTEYRNMRNEVSHNLFRMKSLGSNIFPEFKNYSYTKALAELFDRGMGIFKEFSTFMVPGSPTQETFVKRFKGISNQKLD